MSFKQYDLKKDAVHLYKYVYFWFTYRDSLIENAINTAQYVIDCIVNGEYNIYRMV